MIIELRLMGGKNGVKLFSILTHSITTLPSIWTIRKGALKYLAKFTEKHVCQSLFVNKVY